MTRWSPLTHIPNEPIVVTAQFGLGDNLHHRAVLRELGKIYGFKNIWLLTCHYWLYHDFIAEGMKPILRPTNLRAQAKTIARERHLYSREVPPQTSLRMTLGYDLASIAKYGSLLGAMFGRLNMSVDRPDFSLPIQDGWREKANSLITSWKPTKPILIYRPIVIRQEYDVRSRNPEPDVYSALFNSIRDRFFVVSIADLADGLEWILEGGIKSNADIELHRGELDFETMAALFSEAAMVFSTAGFGPVLAQAVGTPNITIYGGRESFNTTERAGAHLAPSLGIDPDNPCDCHSSVHKCNKHITLEPAREKVSAFVDSIIHGNPRIDLPDVTLVIAETRAHDLARLTINDIVKKVRFGDILIYTNDCKRIAVPGVRYITVPDWPNKVISGAFYYTEAARSITTSHALLMEWDAGLCDPSMWRDEFLQYDYIGAPWGAGMCLKTPNYKVGNGGFALVTKRLVDFCFQEKFKIHTDMHISCNYRREIEASGGFKWAPESVAKDFAYEGWTSRGATILQSRPASFGYHSVVNWPSVLTRDDLRARSKILVADPHGRGKVGLLKMSAPTWLKEELGWHPPFIPLHRSPANYIPTRRRM